MNAPNLSLVDPLVSAAGSVDGFISSRLMAAYELDRGHVIHVARHAQNEDFRTAWHYVLEHDGAPENEPAKYDIRIDGRYIETAARPDLVETLIRLDCASPAARNMDVDDVVDQITANADPAVCIDLVVAATSRATIFEGVDFSTTAGTTYGEAARGVLGFLTLRPGDTDSEYFDGYTPEQIAWRDEYAEELALFALDAEDDQ